MWLLMATMVLMVLVNPLALMAPEPPPLTLPLPPSQHLVTYTPGQSTHALIGQTTAPSPTYALLKKAYPNPKGKTSSNMPEPWM